MQVLHVAAVRRQLEVMECLLSLGIKPNPKSARGWTPLDEAVSQKDRMMVRLIPSRRSWLTGKKKPNPKQVKIQTASRAGVQMLRSAPGLVCKERRVSMGHATSGMAVVKESCQTRCMMVQSAAEHLGDPAAEAADLLPGPDNSQAFVSEAEGADDGVLDPWT